MSPSFPWGMPPNFEPEGYKPTIEVPVAQPVMFVPPPVVHATLYVEELVFHADPSENVSVYERMDECQYQFQAMQNEMKALR